MLPYELDSILPYHLQTKPCVFLLMCQLYILKSCFNKMYYCINRVEWSAILTSLSVQSIMICTWWQPSRVCNLDIYLLAIAAPTLPLQWPGCLPFSVTTNTGDNLRRVSRRQSLAVKLVSLIYTTQCLFTKLFSAVSVVPLVWLA